MSFPFCSQYSSFPAHPPALLSGAAFGYSPKERQPQGLVFKDQAMTFTHKKGPSKTLWQLVLSHDLTPSVTCLGDHLFLRYIVESAP